MRYERNKKLISENEQGWLLGITISIVGLGGLGCYIAEEFTRLGVGCIKLVDSDRFDVTNLNNKPTVGLIYAVNPFGADHQSSEHDPFLAAPEDSRERNRLKQIGIWKGYGDSFTMDSEKVRFALETQKFFSILDTLCLCQFVWGPSWELFGPDDIVELCKTGIGWDTSLVELMLVGERRINMMRFFNSREGFTKEDDILPERIFQKFKDGPSKGITLNRDDFEFAKDLYYKLSGWDNETGNPTEVTLTKLSLNWLYK